jgi:hypothetical protein
MKTEIEPFIRLQESEDEGVSDDGGVKLVAEHDGGGPAVFLNGPYAFAPALLRASTQALAAMKKLANHAGDVPEWNEGGYAYEACEHLKDVLEEVEK